MAATTLYRNSTSYSYSSMLLSNGDPRVRDWPLMGSPVVIVSIIAGYLYFSLYLGPSFMKDRKPFNIRKIVILYNIVMVALSIYFFALTIKLTYVGLRYNLVCQGTDHSRKISVMNLLWHGWWYMLMKVGELLDTVFFVLLKKNAHVSFLHLLHHSLALVTVWLDINNGITGQVAMFPILNCAVHIVMYSYYGLSALDVSVRPNLWWKKHVTQFQIAQFFALLVHGSIPFFYDCGFPPKFAFLMVLEAGIFTYLFSNFYYRNYILGEKTRVE